MLRPLEEPLHTGYAGRGGGGVDEAGGRLRRPGTAPAHSCTSPSIVLIMPGQCAPPGRGDASVPPPHRSTPAPTRLAGALQKTYLLKRGLSPPFGASRQFTGPTQYSSHIPTPALCSIMCNIIVH